MTDTAQPPPQEKFALTTSRGFPDWLAATGGALAFTTYQAGKLLLLGLQDNGRISIFERTIARCMGLAVSPDARRLYLSSLVQLLRFENILAPGAKTQDGYDALFVPRVSWITGDLDIHDIAIGADGRPVFVNTAFSCLATVAAGFSFKPLWRPPFVTKLAAEDRCHLNGLALENGAPRYATAVSQSDVADGWRDKRGNGGILIDIERNEAVMQGFSMPHSPRLHNGKLWILNSGSGDFGFVDLEAGKFEPIAFCPGYARGLAFAGNFAIIGLSVARENRTFQGLGLEAALEKRNAEARCGLMIVDLTTGDASQWVRIEGVVRELFDVAFLPGVTRPSAIGFKGPEIGNVLNIDETDQRQR